MGRRAGQGRGSYALLPRAQATREPIWIEKAVPGHDGQLARSHTHTPYRDAQNVAKRGEAVRPSVPSLPPGSLAPSSLPYVESDTSVKLIRVIESD